MTYNILVTCLGLVLSSCSWPVRARDVTGTYVMNRGRAADTLIVQPNGRYRHIYVPLGGPVQVNTGSWLFHEFHGDWVVSFNDFSPRWRNEMERSQLGRYPIVPGTWTVVPERSLTFRVQLVADDGLDWVYMQRKRGS